MSRRAQVALEYLLLIGLVSVLVILAFRPIGVINQTVNSAAEYYHTGASAIMGGSYVGGQVVMEDPLPINGGWCDWSRCVNGFKVRECACPRKAFGGAECGGSAVDPCI